MTPVALWLFSPDQVLKKNAILRKSSWLSGKSFNVFVVPSFFILFV